MADKDKEFQVIYHEQARSSLIAAMDELLAAGWRKDDIEPLLLEIDTRLKRAPLEFGEQLFTMHDPKLRIAVGFVRPFSVRIGVAENASVVFVRRFVLMTTKKA